MIERAPLRFAFALSAIAAAAGIWVIAVPASPPTEPRVYACPIEGPGLAAMRKLELLMRERHKLVVLLERSPKDRVAIERQLHDVDRRIADLEGEVARYRRSIRNPDALAPPITPSDPITRALYAQPHDIEGCLLEWADRHDNADTRLVVTLTITDDGVARAHLPDLPASDPEQVGMLSRCVAPALLHVPCPELPRDVDAIVTITWIDKTLGFSTVVQPHMSDAETLPM
jgi:hypothetical protein